MDCPYPDCSAKDLAKEIAACSTCRRFVKSCGSCRAPGRAFANFCQRCGQPFPGEDDHWSGYRGGPKRLGLNAAKPEIRLPESRLLPVPNGDLSLADGCFSLLSWDSHLIAISHAGQVEIVEPTTAFHRRLNLQGSVMSCHPCISRSTLFLGQEGRLTAFSLGALTLPDPKTEPRWQLEVEGRPAEALLALGDRLFATVKRRDGRMSLIVVDGVSGSRPAAPRVLLTEPKLSALAGDFLSQTVHLLSEAKGRLQLHCLKAGVVPLRVSSVPFHDLPVGPMQNTVVAAMGNKLFTVVGEEDQLCRLEWGKGAIRLDSDVKKFALGSVDQWGQVETNGIRFPYLHRREKLGHMDRVIGQPLIIRGFAFAVGLQDGRVLLYDWHGPHQQREIRVDSQENGITALASFGPYLATGSARGKVALYEVVAK
ncbi:MAG: hypothetical protein K0U98_05620 [Deltaproteobacteria bacterium]|nr:hypothetical protein [Deltaproteobacteria bacterium]